MQSLKTLLLCDEHTGFSYQGEQCSLSDSKTRLTTKVHGILRPVKGQLRRFTRLSYLKLVRQSLQ